jgi:hypothetical protein
MSDRAYFAGGGGTKRHQPQQIHEQDEEEQRGDKRHIGPPVLATDVCVYDLVANVDNQRLEQVVYACMDTAATTRHW